MLSIKKIASRTCKIINRAGDIQNTTSIHYLIDFAIINYRDIDTDDTLILTTPALASVMPRACGNAMHVTKINVIIIIRSGGSRLK